MAEDKKIIIDEDFKTKAQKEKETLKQQEQKEESSPAQPAEKSAEQTLPNGDFNTIVSLLATQAMFAMGIIPGEDGKLPPRNLPLAKFHIDMLESLETKTKGNLDNAESKLIADALSQLRMGFVSASGEDK